MKKIVVTGAGGFIGGHLAYQCASVFKIKQAAHFETPERAMNVLKKLL